MSGSGRESVAAGGADEVRQIAMREDITAAVGNMPALMQNLDSESNSALAMLEQYLPVDEEVVATAIAADQSQPIVKCVVVVTDRRLILIKPTPHVTSWHLYDIDEVLIAAGENGIKVLVITGDGKSVTLYIDAAWIHEFQRLLRHAVAHARIQQRD
ncbi:MAG TPA: hypothetical protein VNF47_09820 [Streptosporangiaceae bacterium]|nr:hypothetical protein [Streptosporangiaceae bacterium]